MTPSGIKRLLGENKLVRVFSTGQLMGPKLVEMVALGGGFDAFWLDHEHSGVTLEAVAQTVRAVRAAGLDSFVRMAATDYASVMRFLEVGAGGIMAAHVRSAEEAERVVGFVKFPPRGRRGLNGSNRDGDFGRIPHPEYVEMCNRETFVAIQIENAEGLADVEAIARVPDVDLLFIGPADLSSSLGIVGQYDHPKLRAAIDRIIAAADAAGVAWGIVPIGREYTRELVRRGCRMLELGSDIGTIWRGLEAFRDGMAELLPA
ncbi:MAG TPA: aldolase/citrate lyase family protein [Isosphaeraceae bacterium]|jgi:2-dehydro-3-deoxyglucarate aldolase/4-hydroxy-2-oxoheptanedioate aldolase|nr:aldolase/citrate lyase family protein [Isosphaeraceae bacterium]